MNPYRILRFVFRMTWRRLRACILRIRGANVGRRVQIGKVRFINVELSRVSIGDGAVLDDGVVFKDIDRVEIGDYVKIHRETRVEGIETDKHSIHIGHNSWIGEDTIINCHETVAIGNNVGIGCRSQIWSHGYFPSILDGLPFKIAPVSIGDDCWLPPSCVVLPGVTIGERCIIGTGSLVTNSIEAGSFATGIPCKAKKSVDELIRRPSDAVRQRMLSEKLTDYFRNFGFQVTALDLGNTRSLSCRFFLFRFTILICIKDVPAKLPSGNLVLITETPAASPAAGHQTFISLENRSYTKQGTRHEAMTIRALHDMCLVRLLPDAVARMDRSDT